MWFDINRNVRKMIDNRQKYDLNDVNFCFLQLAYGTCKSDVEVANCWVTHVMKDLTSSTTDLPGRRELGNVWKKASVRGRTEFRIEINI